MTPLVTLYTDGSVSAARGTTDWGDYPQVVGFSQGPQLFGAARSTYNTGKISASYHVLTWVLYCSTDAEDEHDHRVNTASACSSNPAIFQRVCRVPQGSTNRRDLSTLWTKAYTGGALGNASADELAARDSTGSSRLPSPTPQMAPPTRREPETPRTRASRTGPMVPPSTPVNCLIAFPLRLSSFVTGLKLFPMISACLDVSYSSDPHILCLLSLRQSIRC